MDPSFLIKQIERMQLQIPLETDPATQREMRKTLKHLHKQYRKATRHTGFKTTVSFVVVLFCALVVAIRSMAIHGGWPLTLLVSTLGAIILTLVTSIVFLQNGVISQQTFKNLVNQCFEALRLLRGGDRASSKHTTLEPPTRRSRSTNPAVPPVTIDPPPALPTPKTDIPEDE
jgi:hypothetical protein